MPKCEMFIGLPASGKSTLVNSIKTDSCWVYSTDAYIERIAKAQSKTYDEVFKDLISTATSEAEKYLTVALAMKTNIIWDQTNLSDKKRRKVITKLQSYGYTIHAHCIVPPETVEDITKWNHRLHSRKGKSIPDFVIANMVKSYVRPTLEEGFASISFYNIYGELDGFTSKITEQTKVN